MRHVHVKHIQRRTLAAMGAPQTEHLAQAECLMRPDSGKLIEVLTLTDSSVLGEYSTLPECVVRHEPVAVAGYSTLTDSLALGDSSTLTAGPIVAAPWALADASTSTVECSSSADWLILAGSLASVEQNVALVCERTLPSAEWILSMPSMMDGPSILVQSMDSMAVAC